MTERNNKMIPLSWFKIHYVPFLIGLLIPLIYEEYMSIRQITTNPSFLSTNIVPKHFNQASDISVDPPPSINVKKSSDKIQSPTSSQYQSIHPYDLTFRHKCAQWINTDIDQRKVLFINFYSNDNRKTNVKIRQHGEQNGDYTIGSNLRKALIENNFQIDDYTFIKPNQLNRLELDSYHRIFYMIHSKNDVLDTKNSVYNHFFTLPFHILCKLRVVINNFLLWDDDDDFFQKSLFSRLDKKQLLVGYPDSRGTFLGTYLFNDNYMKHRQITRREKKGLFRLDQLSSQFEVDIKKAIIDLVAQNFTIHVVCGTHDANTMSCISFAGKGVILHKEMSLEDYMNIVPKCAFTFGVESMFSTGLTSWLDLANGVAILNPIGIQQRSDNQLLQLGRPYVYNIYIQDTNSILEAAESSLKHQFHTYIPSELRPGTMKDRVCAMLESETLCLCPNPTFEINPSIWSDLHEKYGFDSQNIDCRANFLTKKGPGFSPLHSRLE